VAMGGAPSAVLHGYRMDDRESAATGFAAFHNRADTHTAEPASEACVTCS